MEGGDEDDGRTRTPKDTGRVCTGEVEDGVRVMEGDWGEGAERKR